MPWVKVKPGVTHGVGGRYPAGAVFEATAEELRDFGDKFVVVPQPAPPEVLPPPTVQAVVVAESTAEPVTAPAATPAAKPAPAAKRKR